MFTATSILTASPPAIPGLVAHWDAQEGITLNSSGEVEVWADKSGNYYFANAPSGREPGYSQSIADINDKNAVSFYRTGTAANNPYLQIQSGSGYVAGADHPWVEPVKDNSRTIVAVGRTTTITAGTWGAWITQGGGARTSVSFNFQQYPEGEINFASDNYANGGVRDNAGTYENDVFYTAINGWSSWEDAYTDPGSNARIRVNGVESTADAWGSAPALPTRANPRMSLFIDEGNNSAYIAADIAEMIIYDHLLTDSECEAVEAYLRTKYNHY